MKCLVYFQYGTALYTSPACNDVRQVLEKHKHKINDSPTSRQCLSIRRDSATFSPTSVQAGDVNWILARSALTERTRPPVEVEPMLIRRSSFLASFATLVCFLSSVLTPSRRRSRNMLISSSAIYREHLKN